jgi:hypothetical protein
MILTGIELVNSKPPNPSCKPFVEPELIPPVHGDQIAEPLMRQLVRNDVGDTLSEPLIRLSFVEEDSRCAETGQRLFVFVYSGLNPYRYVMSPQFSIAPCDYIPGQRKSSITVGQHMIA